MREVQTRSDEQNEAKKPRNNLGECKEMLTRTKEQPVTNWYK